MRPKSMLKRNDNSYGHRNDDSHEHGRFGSSSRHPKAKTVAGFEIDSAAEYALEQAGLARSAPDFRSTVPIGVESDPDGIGVILHVQPPHRGEMGSIQSVGQT